MSTFKVQIVAVNPQDEKKMTPPIEALVDTGSELTWLPKDFLIKIGITPRSKKLFITATGERVEREIGYVILRTEGYETIDEIVFGDKGDLILLGVRTLEGFSVLVDNIAHRFVVQTALAC